MEAENIIGTISIGEKLIALYNEQGEPVYIARGWEWDAEAMFPRQVQEQNNGN